jgi:hypothetical protein
MNKNQEQLTSMLKTNKISQEDYDILLGAMDKQSFFSQANFSLLLNPFQKIAGVKALLFGLAILFATSFFNAIGNGSLVVSSAGFIQHKTAVPGFFALTGQYLGLWLMLSVCFALTAKLFRKKIRFIDFLGTFAFSYYPSLISMIITAIAQSINPHLSTSIKEMAAQTPPHFSFGIIMYLLILIIPQAWQVATHFYAFKESSGLTSKKLGWGFAITYILVLMVGSQLIVRLIS